MGTVPAGCHSQAGVGWGEGAVIPSTVSDPPLGTTPWDQRSGQKKGWGREKPEASQERRLVEREKAGRREGAADGPEVEVGGEKVNGGQ